MLMLFEIPPLVLEQPIQEVKTEGMVELPFDETAHYSVYERLESSVIEETVYQFLEEEKKQETREKEIEVVPTNPHFNPLDVSELSHLSSEYYYLILGDTGLKDVAWTFPLIEEAYGVNGLFIAGIAALESGWGLSERAVRDFNLTGFNIIDDSSSFSFESRADCLFATAKLIQKDYLNPEGRYYNGTSIEAINQMYCAESTWSDKITQIVYQMLQKL